MGCSTSHSPEENNDQVNREVSENQINIMKQSLKKLLRSKNPEELLVGYLRLDKNIMEEESQSPSSTFGQAISRQHQIKALFQSAVEIKNQNEILSEECSIYDIFADLGIIKNPNLAVEHEEFIASINRREMNQNIINLLKTILENLDNRIKTSSEKIKRLQNLYQQQDELLGQVFGETYGSETEKQLEKEVDTTRHYRDILSIGVLQWEVSSNNIQISVTKLQEGVSSWKSIQNESLKNKINLALEARNCIQEAVLLIQTSEELLQDVQFPYCTTRELRAISQVVDYILTDILIEDRYLHATEVYKNFLQRATALHDWIKQVLDSKLRKDLSEIEEKVSDLTNRLRNERIYLICRKLKLGNPNEALLEGFLPARSATKALGSTDRMESNPLPSNNNAPDGRIFDFDEFPINLESKLGIAGNENAESSDVQQYFRRILEDKKDRMWPSRRIDELQTLVVNQ